MHWWHRDIIGAHQLPLTDPADWLVASHPASGFRYRMTDPHP